MRIWILLDFILTLRNYLDITGLHAKIPLARDHLMPQ